MGVEMNFDATRQALNFVIQSSGTQVGERGTRYQDMSSDYQIGQVHLRIRSDLSVNGDEIPIGRLVRIVKEGLRGNWGFREWVVEDVLTGLRGLVQQDRLSKKFYNEMEVLAWASR